MGRLESNEIIKVLDVLFMAGDPSILAQMLGAFINDLRKESRKEYLN